MDPPPADDPYTPPIHRLPTELLRLILLLSYEPYNSSRWKLGCIDSHTRSIVISTPFFWTAIGVRYIQKMGRDFDSLIDKLRVQLHRCGPVLPLDVFWVTIATEHHISRLLWLFIENNATFGRWKTLTFYAQGIFPSEMLGQSALGEFTALEKLYITGPDPHFFFHHLQKTRDLSKLELVDVEFNSASYEALLDAIPRVLNSVKKIVVQTLSMFASGLPPNVVSLECKTLFAPCCFPHLKRLTIQTCSIRPNPSDIPLVTHLKVRFQHYNRDALVLEFPALKSLELECAKQDLRALTWLAAPNLTSIKLKTVPTSGDPFINDMPPITQLDLLTYPCVTKVAVEIPLDLVELGALLPHFPAAQRMVIPLDVFDSLEGLDAILFDLLVDSNSVEKYGQSKIRYHDLETVQLVPKIQAEFDVDDQSAVAETLMKRFPGSKLSDLRIKGR